MNQLNQNGVHYGDEPTINSRAPITVVIGRCYLLQLPYGGPVTPSSEGVRWVKGLVHASDPAGAALLTAYALAVQS